MQAIVRAAGRAGNVSEQMMLTNCSVSGPVQRRSKARRAYQIKGGVADRSGAGRDCRYVRQSNISSSLCHYIAINHLPALFADKSKFQDEQPQAASAAPPAPAASATAADRDLNNAISFHIQKQHASSGVLLRKTVPANNSCLFTRLAGVRQRDANAVVCCSVHYCLTGVEEPKIGSKLRQIIADTVAADPNFYSNGYLERPNREYCTWILNEDHWGGAIELSILANHFQVLW